MVGITRSNGDVDLILPGHFTRHGADSERRRVHQDDRAEVYRIVAVNEGAPVMFGREPALLIGLVNAVIALAVGFGLDVTPEQVGLINAACAAVLAVVTRQQVTPTD